MTTKDKANTPEQAVDQQQVLRDLLALGKKNGRLSLKEIADALGQLELESDDIDKLYETLETMGVSPLWFGVFVVLLGEFAMVTPPVGIIPYIVHSIAKNPEVNLGVTVTLRDIFVSLLWFLPVGVIFLILMVAVPGMTEWLPDLISRTSWGVSG